MTKAQIHATAIVEDGANIANTVTVGPFCHIGPQVTLDDDVVLHSHVVIMGRTSIGAGTKISPFTQLGGAPQHIGYKGEDTALIVGKNNIIRENVTMNLGTVDGRGETKVGDNGFFMTGVHIAHDCVVHNNVIFANNATLGGHVIIEDYVFIGGLSAVHQFCHIGAHAFVGAYSAAIYDIIPYGSANGSYADLAGLNLIGMKRRDFSKTVINELRSAYRLLFAQEGSFQERLEDVSAMYKDHTEISNVIEFIKSDRSRPIMMPKT